MTKRAIWMHDPTETESARSTYRVGCEHHEPAGSRLTTDLIAVRDEDGCDVLCGVTDTVDGISKR